VAGTRKSGNEEIEEQLGLGGRSVGGVCPESPDFLWLSATMLCHVATHISLVCLRLCLNSLTAVLICKCSVGYASKVLGT
jgi:hypothetical protein